MPHFVLRATTWTNGWMCPFTSGHMSKRQRERPYRRSLWLIGRTLGLQCPKSVIWIRYFAFLALVNRTRHQQSPRDHQQIHCGTSCAWDTIFQSPNPLSQSAWIRTRVVDPYLLALQAEFRKAATRLESIQFVWRGFNLVRRGDRRDFLPLAIFDFF